MKKAFALIILFTNCFLSISQLNDDQQAEVDSLNIELLNANHDTTKADLNLSIATIYYINFQGGQLFANKAIEAKDICEENLARDLSLEERKKFKTTLADCYNAIALYHYSNGEIKETERHFLNAASLHFELRNYPQFLTIIYNLAAMYSGIEDIQKSMKYMQIVIKIARSKEGRNERVLAVALAQMGLDSDLIDPKISEAYHKASYELFVKLEDLNGQTRQLLNLGYSEYAKENYEAALDYYRQSLALGIETGDRVNEIRAYRAMSEIYTQTDSALAIKYYLKALEISSAIEHTDMILSNQNNLSELYFNSKFDSSKHYAYLNVQILENYLPRPGTQHDISKILTEVYSKDGKHRDALAEYKRYITLKDSLFNIENNQEVIRQNMSFEFEKKKAVADKENEKMLAIERKDKEKQKVITFATLGGLILLLVFSVFIYNRFKVTTRQKSIIEDQNDQIVESINYSQRIQSALLPPNEIIMRSLKSCFIYNQPKDIVSGDFYWFKEFESHLVMACVDCTGHGVPGGFMSTMGSLLLNKVVSETDKDPAIILSKLSSEIIETLHQKNNSTIQDGMDLSVCVIDKINNQLLFSGARNGIIVVNGNDVKRYKADLFPVGGNYLKKGKPIDRVFKTQTIRLEKEDTVYMYTDGFMEQCGSKDNLPMNYNQFQEILVAVNQERDHARKNDILKEKFEEWRGDIEQSDDVLILAFNSHY